jgi:ubiquitin C
VSQVKIAIQGVTDMRPEFQQLHFGGRQLEDTLTLQDLGIEREGILHVYLSTDAQLYVYIHQLCQASEDPFLLQVHESYTTEDIKKKIHEMKNIPVDDQTLMYEGEVMKKFQTVCDYQITKDSFIFLKVNEHFQVKVVKLSGDEHILNVSDNMTFHEFVLLVQEATGVHWNFQRLLIDDKILKGSGYTMSDFGIKSQSVITLVETTSFRLWVRSVTIPDITVQVEATNTIEDVKLKIQGVTGIPCDQQRLYTESVGLRAGVEMSQGSEILSYYNIGCDECVCWLVHR